MKGNPNPLKRKLASRFVKAMKKVQRKMMSSPSSMAEKGRRQQAVRAAAYASMASAVGPRRAWSRALLRRTHNQYHKGRIKRNMMISTSFFGLNDLADVVPGGKAMDSCSLLNETAHYITCLTAQVHIMTQILDSSSKTCI